MFDEIIGNDKIKEALDTGRIVLLYNERVSYQHLYHFF